VILGVTHGPLSVAEYRVQRDTWAVECC